MRPTTAQELKATAVLSLPLDEASAGTGGPPPEDPPEDLSRPVRAGPLPMAPDDLTRFRWG